MDASAFIRCDNCGVEFRSGFASLGAVLVAGCVEQCPACKMPVNTPLIAGGRNFERLRRQFEEPMVRDYGDDGYVFMGKGALASSIVSAMVRPIHDAYDRNLHRALDLLELFERVEVEYRQLILGTVVNSTMTAYEC